MEHFASKDFYGSQISKHFNKCDFKINVVEIFYSSELLEYFAGKKLFWFVNFDLGILYTKRKFCRFWRKNLLQKPQTHCENASGSYLAKKYEQSDAQM